MPPEPFSRLGSMVNSAHETRTKIVCTIGPSSNDLRILRDMIREGMDVARINFSHGSREELRDMIQSVRAAATEERAAIAILADLQGPKLRIGNLVRPIDLSTGDWFALTSEPADGTDHVVHLPHPELIASAVRGSHWLLDDGTIELVVRETRPNAVVAQVVVGGTLSSRKGVHAPGATARIAALTEKDRDDARLAVAEGVDLIGLSFVQSADDLGQLRRLVDDLPGGRAIQLLAKIEKREALEALDDILGIADAIMVARGDLGLEIPAEEVPVRQKQIVHACHREGVPVIVATQMLESMIHAPRPTRAEASDVANAILDGADAVMLSGETAVGQYPVRAVSVMREISEKTEQGVQGPPRGSLPRGSETRIADAVSEATARVASAVGASLIVTVTASGYTARRVARERPRQSIVALTPDPIVYRQLALVWGVAPYEIASFTSADEMIEGAERALRESGCIAEDDVIVLTAGHPIGGRGTTNLLTVHHVGESTLLPHKPSTPTA